MDQPLRREIEIKRLVIRTQKNIATDVDYAHVVAIDEDGNEHTFLYVGEDGEDYNIAVASPSSGKVGWKITEDLS